MGISSSRKTHKKNSLQVAAYARESADDSGGTSIPAQLQEIRRFANREGYEVVVEIQDESWKGWELHRPGFDDLLREARSSRRRFEVILVWDYSRFMRDAAEAMSLSDELEAYGVRVISVTEGYTPGAEGRLGRNMKHVINEYYGAQLGRNVLRGHKAGTAKGYAPGGIPPYGYDKVPVQDERGRVHWKYHPNAEEAPWVRWVYEQYANGIAMHRIATELNNQEVPTRRGGRWSSAHISKMIKDHRETYLGNLVFNRLKNFKKQKKQRLKPAKDWVVCYDAHPAIISKDLANAAIERIKAPEQTITGRSHNSDPALLSGLLVCDICGSLYRRRHSQKRKYYACSQVENARLKGCEMWCRPAWIPMDLADEVVSRVVFETLSQDNFVAKLEAAYEDQKAARRENRAERQRKIHREIQNIQKQRERLIDAIASGVLTPDMVKEKMNSLTTALNAQEKELGEVQGTDEEKDEERNAVLDIVRQAQKNLNALLEDTQALRGLLLAFIKKISIRDENLVIHWKLPLSPVRTQLRNAVTTISGYLPH